MTKQTGLILLLAVMTVVVGILTVLAFQREGAGLFDVFVGNMLAGGWNGQFNADFTCYLLLSGLWLMWRNHFRPGSILLASLPPSSGSSSSHLISFTSCSRKKETWSGCWWVIGQPDFSDVYAIGNFRARQSVLAEALGKGTVQVVWTR